MGVGGHFRGGAIQQNPNYIAPDPWAAHRDEEGIVTLDAWQSMFPIDIATGIRNAPGPWSTAVVLPLGPAGQQLRVLEAWYGHPTNATLRIDITDRIRKLLDGPTQLPGGLVLTGHFFKDGQLCLPAETSLWGEDPCPWTWKKLSVRFRAS